MTAPCVVVCRCFPILAAALVCIAGVCVGWSESDAEQEVALKKRTIDAREAQRIGSLLGIDWAKVDPEQFRRGLEVEFEHGSRDPETNVTNDDVVLTGKIAWAHLKEFPDYYSRLDRLESEADAYWSTRKITG